MACFKSVDDVELKTHVVNKIGVNVRHNKPHHVELDEQTPARIQHNVSLLPTSPARNPSKIDFNRASDDHHKLKSTNDVVGNDHFKPKSINITAENTHSCNNKKKQKITQPSTACHPLPSSTPAVRKELWQRANPYLVSKDSYTIPEEIRSESDFSSSVKENKIRKKPETDDVLKSNYARRKSSYFNLYRSDNVFDGNQSEAPKFQKIDEPFVQSEKLDLNMYQKTVPVNNLENSNINSSDVLYIHGAKNASEINNIIDDKYLLEKTLLPLDRIQSSTILPSVTGSNNQVTSVSKNEKDTCSPNSSDGYLYKHKTIGLADCDDDFELFNPYSKPGPHSKRDFCSNQHLTSHNKKDKDIMKEIITEKKNENSELNNMPFDARKKVEKLLDDCTSEFNSSAESNSLSSSWSSSGTSESSSGNNIDVQVDSNAVSSQYQDQHFTRESETIQEQVNTKDKPTKDRNVTIRCSLEETAGRDSNGEQTYNQRHTSEIEDGELSNKYSDGGCQTLYSNNSVLHLQNVSKDLVDTSVAHDELSFVAEKKSNRESQLNHSLTEQNDNTDCKNLKDVIQNRAEVVEHVSSHVTTKHMCDKRGHLSCEERFDETPHTSGLQVYIDKILRNMKEKDEDTYEQHVLLKSFLLTKVDGALDPLSSEE